MANEYPDNKRDGVFTGETRTITTPDPAAIPPNKPRPEEVSPTRFVYDQPAGVPGS